MPNVTQEQKNEVRKYWKQCFGKDLADKDTYANQKASWLIRKYGDSLREEIEKAKTREISFPFRYLEQKIKNKELAKKSQEDQLGILNTDIDEIKDYLTIVGVSAYDISKRNSELPEDQEERTTSREYQQMELWNRGA